MRPRCIQKKKMVLDEEEADEEEDLSIGTTPYSAFLFRVKSSTKFAIFCHISNRCAKLPLGTTTRTQAKSSNKIV